MSAASPSLQEPSMEEILSSIRRIIADDPGDSPKEDKEVAKPAREGDVLDLAEIAAAKRTSATPLDIALPEISFRGADDEAEEDPVRMDAPIPAMPEPSWEDAMRAEPPPAPKPAPALPPELIAPPPQLISPKTDAVVNQAFGMLAHTVLTNNARTLEDLVKDMLRPMLQTWLDENLPSMVERLVRAEIERVTRGGR
jgi:uncharacterized protein